MRTILVEGATTFKINIEDGDQLTFGPWSPPGGRKDRGEWRDSDKRGTLRVYRGDKNHIIACFTDVIGFRDTSLDYSVKVATQEVSELWKSDEKGYEKQVKHQRAEKWVSDPPALPAARSPRRKK